MNASQGVLTKLWTNVSVILQPGIFACSSGSEVVAGKAVPADGIYGCSSADRTCFLLFSDLQLLFSLCQELRKAKGMLRELGAEFKIYYLWIYSFFIYASFLNRSKLFNYSPLFFISFFVLLRFVCFLALLLFLFHFRLFIDIEAGSADEVSNN